MFQLFLPIARLLYFDLVGPCKSQPREWVTHGALLAGGASRTLNNSELWISTRPNKKKRTSTATVTGELRVNNYLVTGQSVFTCCFVIIYYTTSLELKATLPSTSSKQSKRISTLATPRQRRQSFDACSNIVSSERQKRTKTNQHHRSLLKPW